MKNKLDTCETTVIHEEVVETVKKQLPTEERIERLANFYKTFGDPTKVKILWALDISEMCVCDLAAITDVTKSAISHQLSFLKEMNLVKSRRAGKIVYYSLSDECVKEILEKGVIHTMNSKG